MLILTMRIVLSHKGNAPNTAISKQDPLLLLLHYEYAFHIHESLKLRFIN